MPMIKIDGLTKHQRELLDKMWSMDTLDEVREWQWSLSDQDQLLVESLIEVVGLAYIDEMVDASESFDTVQKTLAVIFKK